jgi:hypothetical protein
MNREVSNLSATKREKHNYKTRYNVRINLDLSYCVVDSLGFILN